MVAWEKLAVGPSPDLQKLSSPHFQSCKKKKDCYRYERQRFKSSQVYFSYSLTALHLELVSLIFLFGEM